LRHGYGLFCIFCLQAHNTGEIFTSREEDAAEAEKAEAKNRLPRNLGKLSCKNSRKPKKMACGYFPIGADTP
jgi:hypothetical protein